jgi:hypothetical protein
MNMPNLGKYASVGNLPFTTQKLNYHRGYGNIVVHDVDGKNNVTTHISKFNRIEPLTAPFGEHLPPARGPNPYQMFNSETSIAWATNNFDKR